jgi:hypothetical protein
MVGTPDEEGNRLDGIRVYPDEREARVDRWKKRSARKGRSPSAASRRQA